MIKIKLLNVTKGLRPRSSFTGHLYMYKLYFDRGYSFLVDQPPLWGFIHIVCTKTFHFFWPRTLSVRKFYSGVHRELTKIFTPPRPWVLFECPQSIHHLDVYFIVNIYWTIHNTCKNNNSFGKWNLNVFIGKQTQK